MGLTIQVMQEQAYANARGKGFWSPPYVSSDWHHDAVAKLGLVTSEVGEAVNAVRLAPTDEDVDDVAGELADIMLRTGDLATWLGIDLTAAIEEKFANYSNRPHRHGKAY